MGRYAVMKELGGEVIIQNPSPSIEKIMLLAGMERVVKIEATKSQSANAQRPLRRTKKGTQAVKKEVSGS